MSWRDNINPELMKRIKNLTLEQAQEAIIYFCGYDNGESLVRQALK